MAKIVIVDDHLIVMESLQYLIEDEGKHQVVAKFPLAQEFLIELKAGNLYFEILILDVKLPDLSGIEVAKIMREKFPEIKVILLSQYKNKDFVLAGLQEGVMSYLLKSCSGEELIKAIEVVSNNLTFLSQEIATIVVKNHNSSKITFNLTEREREILELIVFGFSNKQIAQKLCIETDGVEYHKRNLRQKLKVNKSVELAVKAIELGFVHLN
ncbi:MAG: response regulator transcription factor [Flavobacteriia bacterium]|nr:response regulator transcription factor [Flavobacteriia bacterium]